MLVAEDEPMIRMDAIEELTLAGFDVHEANNAQEALAVLDDLTKKIEALFTDVHMLGSMNGLELAHHVKKNWPEIALLIASGHARPTLQTLPHGSRFVEKPYDLRNVVRHLLELTQPH